MEESLGDLLRELARLMVDVAAEPSARIAGASFFLSRWRGRGRQQPSFFFVLLCSARFLCNLGPSIERLTDQFSCNTDISFVRIREATITKKRKPTELFFCLPKTRQQDMSFPCPPPCIWPLSLFG